MKNLDLFKLWGILNKIYEKEDSLSEQDIFISILGTGSDYNEMPFDEFLEYYSFRLQNQKLCIFNDDSVPYEHFNVEDFSYLPIEVLSLSDNEINNWIDNQVELEIAEKKADAIQNIENKKLEIKRLQQEIVYFSAEN